MKTVYEMLMELKNKYPLFLKRKSFDQLMLYIDKYNKCLSELFGEDQYGILENIDDLVKKYFDVNFESHNWKEVLVFYCHDDEKAFDKFYELLDIYLKKDLINYEKECLRQKKYEKFRVNQNFEVIATDSKYLTSGTVFDYINADKEGFKDNEFVKKYLSNNGNEKE